MLFYIAIIIIVWKIQFKSSSTISISNYSTIWSYNEKGTFINKRAQIVEDCYLIKAPVIEI